MMARFLWAPDEPDPSSGPSSGPMQLITLESDLKLEHCFLTCRVSSVSPEVLSDPLRPKQKHSVRTAQIQVPAQPFL